MKYSDSQIEYLLAEIYAGVYGAYNLPEDLYFAIADYLKKALYEGFGSSLSSLPTLSKDYALLNEMRTNIYAFSGAKTYQEVVDMSALLTSDGGVSSFRDFKSKALSVYETYNKNYLETEYNTAIAQAQNANRWLQVEERADVLPYLTYNAVMDANTSEICRSLDGITLPVNDAFWRKFMPPNHFNCRCVVTQTDDAKVSSKSQVKEARQVETKMNDLFVANPGMTQIAFSDKHPYFTVAEKDKDYAKRNFNLPIPEKD